MIRLQFVATIGPWAHLIQMYQHSWANHVDAVLPDGSLLGSQPEAYGGAGPGVQIRPAGYLRFVTVDRVDLVATPEQERVFYNFLRAQIGCEYDWLNVYRFVLGDRAAAKVDWFCSELIAAALSRCGWWPAPPAKPFWQITPGELLLMVSPYRR